MKLMSKIFDIFDYFGIDDYFTSDSMIIGSCPIHQGDNNQAFNINIDPSSEYYGAWFCNTKHCHNNAGNDILALVNGLLNTKSHKAYSFREVLRFAKEFTKGVIADSNMVSGSTDALSKILEKNAKTKVSGKHTRKQVRERLVIPCEFYLSRGYSPEALDEFDVGTCEDPKSEMYKRAVFPIYDEGDEYMIGCVGRTICEDQRKWINKKGFNKSSFLYNYGKAIKHIDKSSTIILVEGQGDVIRLYEAGILNAVGIFGSHLSDSQEFLLQKSGALNVVIMTDSDDAGQRCRDEIKEKLQYSFNIYDVITPSNDIGDMTIEQINEIIKPQMKGLY